MYTCDQSLKIESLFLSQPNPNPMDLDLLRLRTQRKLVETFRTTEHDKNFAAKFRSFYSTFCEFEAEILFITIKEKLLQSQTAS